MEIETGIADGERRDIKLPKPVPVAFVYLTGYAGPDGRAQFRDDIYGLDSPKPAPLPAPAAAAAPKPAEPAATGSVGARPAGPGRCPRPPRPSAATARRPPPSAEGDPAMRWGERSEPTGRGAIAGENAVGPPVRGRPYPLHHLHMGA